MKAITLHQPWASFIANGMKHFETRAWPTQRFVALVNLVGCWPITPQGILMPLRGYMWPSSDEQRRGNWHAGRYAWDLRNVLKLKLETDVPSLAVRGNRGLWDPPSAVIEHVRRTCHL